MNELKLKKKTGINIKCCKKNKQTSRNDKLYFYLVLPYFTMTRAKTNWYSWLYIYTSVTYWKYSGKIHLYMLVDTWYIISASQWRLGLIQLAYPLFIQVPPPSSEPHILLYYGYQFCLSLRFSIRFYNLLKGIFS